jgi:hypothetical protein
MAIPCCPKCGQYIFGIQEIEILNAKFRHNVICCQSCGCVVATEELLSVMYMLGKIAEKLDVQFDL